MPLPFEHLLSRYESGGITRRHFLQAVAATAAAATTAGAQPGGLLEATMLHHVEVKSLDFERAGRFYQHLLGGTLDVRPDRSVVELPGGAHLSIGAANTQSSIDHYAFSIRGYDSKNPKPLLDRLGAANVAAKERSGSLFITDPDGRQFQVVPQDFKP